MGHLVIHAAQALEFDRSQYLAERIQVWTTADEFVEVAVLSLYRHLALEFVHYIESLDNPAADKRDVCS